MDEALEHNIPPSTSLPNSDSAPGGQYHAASTLRPRSSIATQWNAQDTLISQDHVGFPHLHQCLTGLQQLTPAPLEGSMKLPPEFDPLQLLRPKLRSLPGASGTEPCDQILSECSEEYPRQNLEPLDQTPPPSMPDQSHAFSSDDVSARLQDDLGLADLDECTATWQLLDSAVFPSEATLLTVNSSSAPRVASTGDFSQALEEGMGSGVDPQLGRNFSHLQVAGENSDAQQVEALCLGASLDSKLEHVGLGSFVPGKGRRQEATEFECVAGVQARGSSVALGQRGANSSTQMALECTTGLQLTDLVPEGWPKGHDGLYATAGINGQERLDTDVASPFADVALSDIDVHLLTDGRGVASSRSFSGDGDMARLIRQCLIQQVSLSDRPVREQAHQDSESEHFFGTGQALYHHSENTTGKGYPDSSKRKRREREAEGDEEGERDGEREGERKGEGEREKEGQGAMVGVGEGVSAAPVDLWVAHRKEEEGGWGRASEGVSGGDSPHSSDRAHEGGDIPEPGGRTGPNSRKISLEKVRRHRLSQGVKRLKDLMGSEGKTVDVVEEAFDFIKRLQENTSSLEAKVAYLEARLISQGRGHLQ